MLGEQRNPKQRLLLLWAAIWCVAVGSGLMLLWNYQAKAGPVLQSPSTWPVESSIQRSLQRPTLLIFAHPRCPCTRATIFELEQIMTRCHDLLDAKVCFYQPSHEAALWGNTDLRRYAQQIPGLQVHTDLDRREASRFGAATSGHAFVYSTDGQLMFSGGITDSRGHAGFSTGRASIEAIAAGRPPQVKTTEVFGCALSEAISTESREVTQP